jgi:hypothetical protein
VNDANTSIGAALGGIDNLEDSFQRLYSRELDLDEGNSYF